MKFTLYLFLAFSSTLFAGFEDQDGSDYDGELNEKDVRAVREFIQTKRDIPLEKKLTKMYITGDVRAEWRHLNETGRKGKIEGDNEILRGENATDYADLPVSRNDFDAEFNLYFEYKTDRSWASAQLQFDNSMGVFDNNKKCPGEGDNSPQGIRDKMSNGKDTPDPHGWHGSGKCDKICLKKAYWGYNLYNACDSRIDIEVGRRRLYAYFDSDIQFLSQFDGIALKISDKIDWASSTYLNIAGFVVNERINHLAFAAESGLLDIADTGFDLKYSFIHWRKNGRCQCPNKKKGGWFRDPEAFRFLISQVSAYYHLNPDYFCGKEAFIYAGYLYNHDQKFFRLAREHGSSKPGPKVHGGNTGWYAGIAIGEVKKENDWAFDASYQYVGAVAVPDGDSRGIGRGNVLDESLTSIERGNTNFKGWTFDFTYAITNELSVNTVLEWTKAADERIGGKHTYSKFELETIYAF